MKIKGYILSLLVILTLIASCRGMFINRHQHDIVPFTFDMLERIEKDSIDLKKVQFFTCCDLVLERILPTDTLALHRGTVKYVNGHYVERIIFKKHTPGILCETPGERTLTICFDNEKYLQFENIDFDYYYLVLDGNYGSHYGNYHYEVTRGLNTILSIRKDQLDQLIANEQIVPGEWILPIPILDEDPLPDTMNIQPMLDTLKVRIQDTLRLDDYKRPPKKKGKGRNKDNRKDGEYYDENEEEGDFF